MYEIVKKKVKVKIQDLCSKILFRVNADVEGWVPLS